MLEASAVLASACPVSDEKLVATGWAIASPSGFVLTPAAMFPSKTALPPALGGAKT
jgi:hypothetical protein